MRYCGLAAVVILAVIAAGCVSHAKPAPVLPSVPSSAGDAAKTVPAPEPLSAPQTQIEPWPAQPLDPEALVLEQQPASPAPAPAPPSPPPSAHRTFTPPAPKPETPPAAADAAPQSRPMIQEQLPDARRTLESAHSKQRAIQTWLDSNPPQRLTGEAKRKRDSIQSLLKASKDAEGRSDLTAAEQLADRAELVIREFQGGR
jgi:hypothetical protein